MKNTKMTSGFVSKCRVEFDDGEASAAEGLFKLAGELELSGKCLQQVFANWKKLSTVWPVTVNSGGKSYRNGWLSVMVGLIRR